MGSLNVAEHTGKDFSVRFSSAGVMREIGTAGDGMAAAYSAEGSLSLARCS